MGGEGQGETIDFVRQAAFEGVDPAALDEVTTHISVVQIGGDRAFKLKRAVKLGYVDFATPERRVAACQREVELNRRTAPMLYKGVRRIVRGSDGCLALDGEGTLVDAVVEMARFDGDGLFDQMAIDGRLTAPLMTRLARHVAGFHAGLPAERGTGGAAVMAGVLDINERALATTTVFPTDEVAAFNRRFRATLSVHAALLDRRGETGKIRRCHGDLHLHNICLVGGEPTLFDCLEFDEAMATTDILYDLAFLLMDLWHRGLEEAANLVLNRYLDEIDETEGLPLLPFLMAVRAAVRAHVTATQAVEGGTGAARLADEARAYFDLARELLEPRAPRVVAVGGLSGSGKSTVAAAIAPEIGPPPGARIVSSDRLRKRLFAVPVETRLPAECYTADVSDRVYDAMIETAERIARLRHGVVADGVFDRPSERARIAAAAEAAGLSFTGLWLEAPTDRLLERVARRTADPSDATTDVVREQVARDRDPVEWEVLPSEASIEIVADRARQLIVRR
ncbi:AAA family ATPase [Aurantimonas aggregata]|uniref:AAA family ATPase n=1 Tax=Aurantimonas aggregata TaxID=2047720 RepID=A0A6L9MC81_9HYPH|nr:bifunctional aminoglycoside phosphotransferase/ATP-binding protein [Aurantimonas aggregata]NDV85429.1 AAA family ATPase [Aurantimonas aggregata]